MHTPTPQSPPPKPVSELWRPDLVRLPELNAPRRGLRAFLRAFSRLLVSLCMRLEIKGMENFPLRGPALIVVNHLGDADTVVMLAALPAGMDVFAKIEMFQFPLLGGIMQAYGVIWLHRGQPDRKALRAALEGFSAGRMIVIAPEGRYSLIKGLEAGTNGAAFLARKANVSIVPVALTGTENGSVYGHLKRLRRAPATLTVGMPFRLAEGETREDSHSLEADTQRIMESLAGLLPEEYRGVYATPQRI